MKNMKRLFCEACGEEEEFRAEWTERRDIECESRVDNQGQTINPVDEYDVEVDVSKEKVFTCDNCDREIDLLSEEEIIELKIKHLSNDGEWSEEELDEKEWNKELLKEHMARKL